MIPVTVQTLIVSAAPSPSIIVLQPVEEIVQEGKSRIIPIWVGVNEATQMGIALEKARFSRPMTHDLFLDALTNLDAQIDHVVINDVQGATFFARLAAAPARPPHRPRRAPERPVGAGRAAESSHLYRGGCAGACFVPLCAEADGTGSERSRTVRVQKVSRRSRPGRFRGLTDSAGGKLSAAYHSAVKASMTA